MSVQIASIRFKHGPKMSYGGERLVGHVEDLVCFNLSKSLAVDWASAGNCY